MIRVDCQQGTEEWMALRRGVVSASRFAKFVTPKTLKLSTSQTATTARMKLLAEWLCGKSDDEYVSDWMSRGFMLQPEAIDWYEMQTDSTVDQSAGFIYLDDERLVGCSPDGLIGDDGGIEVKCPSGGVHMAFLLDPQVPDEYVPQVQGCMWVTGRKWWDFVSYHPDMPSARVRVERDEAYVEGLANGINAVVEMMKMERQALLDKGYQPV